MNEVEFKRLLTPARAEENVFFRSDWTLNLYRGCNHGCIYCDSRSVCYHMEDFGHVRVKKDCLRALDQELKSKKRAGVIAMGAASDAYNELEARLEVTRGALQSMLRYGFGVMIATKSALIARDADLLSAIARQGSACVAFSITTADAGLASFLEPNAPAPARRFEAMRALADVGVTVGTWLNPMLPFLTDTERNIRETLRASAEAGAAFALCHFGMTLREGDREYFYRALECDPRYAPLKTRYADTFGLSYVCASPDADRLSEFFHDECARLGLADDFETVNRLASAREARQTTLW